MGSWGVVGSLEGMVVGSGVVSVCVGACKGLWTLALVWIAAVDGVAYRAPHWFVERLLLLLVTAG